MEDSTSPKPRGAIKGTLRVKGQTTRSSAAPRCDLPAHCERCKKKTLGSLQLPCGRQVRLCEACSLEFYDILMERIAQCDTEFQDFLREQKRKEAQAAKEKEQSQQIRSSSRNLLAGGTPKSAVSARQGRFVAQADTSEGLDGWKGSGGANLDKRGKDIFTPLNRAHPPKEPIPSLNGVAATGVPKRRGNTSNGGRGPALTVNTADPGSRQGANGPEVVGMPTSPTSPRQPNSPLTPKQRWTSAQAVPLMAGSLHPQDAGLAAVGSSGSPKSRGASPNGRMRSSLTRHGSGGSVGSNGSNVGGSPGRRHSIQSNIQPGGAPILRSSEIREGGKVAMGAGAKPRGVVNKGQRGGLNGHLEDLIKASPHLARGETSVREMRQKIGAMEDLMSLQGTRRA